MLFQNRSASASRGLTLSGVALAKLVLLSKSLALTPIRLSRRIHQVLVQSTFSVSEIFPAK